MSVPRVEQHPQEKGAVAQHPTPPYRRVVSPHPLTIAINVSTDDFVIARLINYCNNTRDFMVPSVWGQVCFASRVQSAVQKSPC